MSTGRPNTDAGESRRAFLERFYDMIEAHDITITLFNVWDDLSFVNHLRAQAGLPPKEAPQRQSFQLDLRDLSTEHKIVYVHVEAGTGKATIGSSGTYVNFEATDHESAVKLYVVLETATYGDAIQDVNHTRNSKRHAALAVLHEALENPKTQEEASVLEAITTTPAPWNPVLRQESTYAALPHAF